MTTDVKTISFARGAPSLDIVAVDDLRAAANAAFENDPAGAVGYGTAVGYPPLREWIAARHGVGKEHVVVTNGSLHACSMVFDRLIEPGDLVAIEQPLYDRSLLGLRQRGAELLPLPLLEDGLDIGALEQELARGRKLKFLYTIPHFHNPGGCTLSVEKRQRLLELAQEHDFLIVEDDPYRDVSFAGEPLPSMHSLDPGGERVIYLCSFTKTVCPGLRIGYVVAGETLIGDLVTAATNTYISPGMVSEAILHQFIEAGHLDTAVATVRQALRERRDALCQALREHLPGTRFVEPQGGYFLWAELTGGIDTDALAPRAVEAGVPFAKGSDFMIEGGRNCLRLSYSSAPAADMDEGIARLAGLIANG